MKKLFQRLHSCVIIIIIREALIAYVFEIAAAAVQNAHGLSFLQKRIADETFTIGINSDECHGDIFVPSFEEFVLLLGLFQCDKCLHVSQPSTIL